MFYEFLCIIKVYEEYNVAVRHVKQVDKLHEARFRSNTEVRV